MQIKEKEVPNEVRTRGRSFYKEIYAKINEKGFGSIAVECDDEKEATRIYNAMRGWAYRNKDKDGERWINVYLDGVVVWVEKKAS